MPRREPTAYYATTQATAWSCSDKMRADQLRHVQSSGSADEERGEKEIIIAAASLPLGGALDSTVLC